MSTSERTHDRRYRKTYGIGLKDVKNLWYVQGGNCASCNDPVMEPPYRTTHLDHHHATGAVRGILCCNCNQALGKLKDDPLRIENLKQYIIKHTTTYVLTEEV